MLAALLVVSLGFYATNVVHYEKLPLRVEEAVWPPMARAVHDRGVPSVPAKEDHRIRLTPEHEVDTGPLSGLWHPPLYVYSLGASMVILGTDAAASLRLVGVVGLLACCALFFLIARELFGGRWFLVGSVASALLLVHPYAVQGSMFLDIDTTIYAPLFLLFVWLLVRFDRRPPPESRLVGALAVAFALVLWAKLPTAFVLVPVAGLYWILRHGARRGATRAVLVFVGGAVLFLATYWLYVTATGQSFSYMFDFTLFRKGGHFVWKQGVSALKDSLNWQVEWFSPALLLMVGAYGAYRARRWLRTRVAEPLDFVWGLGLAIWLAYAVIAPNGGGPYQAKYAFPAIPLLIFAITGWVLGRGAPRLDLRSLGLAVAVGALAVIAMPDLLTNRLFGTAGAKLKAAIVLGSAAALWIGVRGLRRRSLMPVGALVVCFALFAGQSIHSYNADTSPLYSFADTEEFRWEANRINELQGPGELALVPKDEGFYVRGAIIEGEDMWNLGGDEYEARLLRRWPRITVVAGNSFFTPVLGPKTATVLAECFTAEWLGDGRERATVFLRKPSCRTTAARGESGA